MSGPKSLKFNGHQPITIKQWKVKEGDFVSAGTVLFTYTPVVDTDAQKQPELKFKSDAHGSLEAIHCQANDAVAPGGRVATLGACRHPVVMKNMCAECGVDLQCEDDQGSASVAMLHSIPELRVSREQAETLGKQDAELLLKHEKLVLLVDLDQTLIHTTNDSIPANIKDVYHFQLYGRNSPWYHTRFRPGLQKFLQNVSKFYELHICTFGARLYAHTIARFLDPNGVYFSNRILSRDECFDQNSKTANLRALFPCGDKMVCIIDDREDVWNYAPNLIHVKPYHFFKHTGDINAPPGLEKVEQDDKEGYDFESLKEEEEKAIESEQSPTAEPVQRRDSMPCFTDDEDTNETENQPDGNQTVAETEEKVKPEEKSKPVSTEGDLSENLSDDLNLSDDEDSPSGADGEVKAGPSVTSSLSQEHGKAQTKESAAADQASSGSSGGEPANVENNGNKEGAASETESDSAAVKASGEPGDTASNEQGSTANPAGKNEKPECAAKATKPDRKDVNNGALPAPGAEKEIDVEDHDDYLLYLEDVLMLIHKAFYSMLKKKETAEGPDLRLLIPYVRKKILKGVRIVFSGVVPNNVKLNTSKPYQVAVNLGATVQEKLVRKGARDELTTHLVAARTGTAKVNEALRSKRIKLVTLDWLWTCAERWERVDERLFPLRAETTVSRTPPAHCTSPDPEGERSRRLSFQESLNPLLSFSPDDIARMDEEVEDILMSDDPEDDEEDARPAEAAPSRPSAPPPPRLPAAGDDDRDDDDDDVVGDELDDESQPDRRSAKRRLSDDEASSDDEETPAEKFRRGEPLPSDDELGGDGNSDNGPDLEEDWSMMGAELERELGD